MIATLASLLRDGLAPSAALAATEEWTRTTSRAAQETILQRSLPPGAAPPRPRQWRPDAPRRAERAADQQFLARARAVAPSDFDEAMIAVLAGHFKWGVQEPARAIAGTRAFLAQEAARRGRHATG